MQFYTIKEMLDIALKLKVHQQRHLEAGEVILIANEKKLYVAENVYNALQNDYQNAIDNIFITEIL